MGNIIIPGRPNPPAQQRIELPHIPLHPELQADIDRNGLEVEFGQAVGKTLNRTLSHPDTALRVVTAEALKERVQRCYDVIKHLRFDMKFPLRKCFDLLPAKMFEELRTGKRAEDDIEATAMGKMWNKGTPPKQIEMPRQDLIDGDMTEEAEQLSAEEIAGEEE